MRIDIAAFIQMVDELVVINQHVQAAREPLLEWILRPVTWNPQMQVCRKLFSFEPADYALDVMHVLGILGEQGWVVETPRCFGVIAESVDAQRLLKHFEVEGDAIAFNLHVRILELDARAEQNERVIHVVAGLPEILKRRPLIRIEAALQSRVQQLQNMRS